MSEEDIENTIAGYVKAATISQQAGFTGVQVHSAHGYLMSQFLSPLTNVRTDKWGGTIDNRCRILTTIVERIRETTGPSFPISVKINSSDFQRGGFSEEDSLYVIGKLSDLGIDLLEVSGGTYEQSKFLLMNARDSTRKREAYFIEFAQKVRDISSIPLMVTGGFRTRAAMEQALTEGGASLIGLGRPLCVQTDGPKRLLDGADALPRYEDDLALFPSWLNFLTAINAIRAVASFATTYWYYAQIESLGQKGATEDTLSVRAALSRVTAQQKSFLKARAKAFGK